MTQNTASFKIPLADELCGAVRAAVLQLGGDTRQFLEKLGDESGGFVDAFARDNWSMRRLLARCLENSTFRARILAQLSDDVDKEFLAQFFDAWDVWKEVQPLDHDWIVRVFTGSPFEQILNPIPSRANEFFRSFSSIQLDSYFEEFRFKTAIQLAFANKQLGGDGVLLLTGGLSSFFNSLTLLFNSFVLSEQEVELFNFHPDNKEIGNITAELNNIKSAVDTLIKQFDGMTTGSRRLSQT